MRCAPLCGSLFIGCLLLAMGVTWSVTRERPVAVSANDRPGPTSTTKPSSGLALAQSAAEVWAADQTIRNSKDLVEVCGSVLDLWSDQITADQYVDVLSKRGGQVTANAVELANRRRALNQDLFPPDEEWSDASPEDKLRSYLRYTWSAHPPVKAFDADTVEAWTGQVRAMPSGYKTAQGMLARFTPPGISLADIQNANDAAWIRVHAQLHEHESEHVIDFKFILDPGTKRWFPAEVRVYGDQTDFNWAI